MDQKNIKKIVLAYSGGLDKMCIRDRVCTALRRARRGAIANPQAPSHTDPRTATLHARAKLRPKRLFLLHRARSCV